MVAASSRAASTQLTLSTWSCLRTGLGAILLNPQMINGYPTVAYATSAAVTQNAHSSMAIGVVPLRDPCDRGWSGDVGRLGTTPEEDDLHRIEQDPKIE